MMARQPFLSVRLSPSPASNPGHFTHVFFGRAEVRGPSPCVASQKPQKNPGRRGVLPAAGAHSAWVAGECVRPVLPAAIPPRIVEAHPRCGLGARDRKRGLSADPEALVRAPLRSPSPATAFLPPARARQTPCTLWAPAKLQAVAPETFEASPTRRVGRRRRDVGGGQKKQTSRNERHLPCHFFCRRGRAERRTGQTGGPADAAGRAGQGGAARRRRRRGRGRRETMNYRLSPIY